MNRITVGEKNEIPPILAVAAALSSRPPMTEPEYSAGLARILSAVETCGGDDHETVDRAVRQVIAAYQYAAMQETQ